MKMAVLLPGQQELELQLFGTLFGLQVGTGQLRQKLQLHKEITRLIQTLLVLLRVGVLPKLFG